MRKLLIWLTLLTLMLLSCGGASIAPQSNYHPDDLKRTYILYDYYTDWCGVCKQLEPELETLKTRYKGKVKVNRVNVDKYPQLAREKGIRGVPTLILSDGTHDVAKSVGYKSYNDLAAWIHKIDAGG